MSGDASTLPLKDTPIGGAGAGVARGLSGGRTSALSRTSTEERVARSWRRVALR